MIATDGIDGSATVAGWSDALGELHERISRRFARSEAPGTAPNATSSVCSGGSNARTAGRWPRPSGSGTPRASSASSTRPGGMPTSCATNLREYVVEHLGDEESGVLIVDETGFLKKGTKKSVGVARQYTGTAGDTVNCQVGVFLAYASEKGAAFVDRALYLPKAWAKDPERRAEAGVPEGIVFRNKVELAEIMLERAFEAGVPARWVVAGSFLRPPALLPGMAGRAGASLRRDGPQDQRRPSGRAQEEDRAEHVERLPKDAFSEVRPARDGNGRRAWETGRALTWPRTRRRGCGDGCSCAGAPTTRTTWASTRPTARRGRGSKNRLGYARTGGKWSSASPRRKGRSAWTTTR